MSKGLADRVSNRAQVATRGGGEVEQGGGPQTPPTLRKQIEEMLPQFELAMPKGFEARQLMRDAFTLMRTTEHLSECVPETVLGGLMTFAQLGLRPGVLGQGWLLPFKRNRQINGKWHSWYEAQIVVGYQGYKELAYRSGSVRRIAARCVHANDHIEVVYGTQEDLIHRPAMRDRGEVTGYYSVISLDRGDPLTAWMNRDDMIQWRNKYAMSAKKNRETGEVHGSGPWFEMDGPPGMTNFDRMAEKTVMLQAKRFAPTSPERLLFDLASEVDGSVRMKITGSVKDPETARDDASFPDPEEREIIDVEPEPEPAARERVAVQHRPDDDVPPPAEPPAPAGGTHGGGDGPATDPQGKALAAIIRQGLGKTPGAPDRRTILGALIGRQIESQKEVTFAEASRAIDTLNTWQKAGELGDRLRAMLGAGVPQTPAAGEQPGGPAGDTRAAAGGPPAGELPAPGTRAWHEQGHPRAAEGGRVTTVPTLLNGDCGLCEEPDPRDDDPGYDEQMTLGG